MFAHPALQNEHSGAERRWLPEGTDALPAIGTTHTFAPNNPRRLDTYELSFQNTIPGTVEVT
jgi:hypothetical protein